MAAPKKVVAKSAGISSEAVEKATGRSWRQWIASLNAAGAKTMEHRAIAELVSEKFGVGPWWCQMVTVGYEQAAKGRAKHSKGSVFEISGSKTINAPVAALFEAWKNPEAREKWLPDEVRIRMATKNKSMRLTWMKDETVVSVNFLNKGAGKSHVQLGHGKIKTAAGAERMKKYWAKRLGELKGMLEARSGA